MTFLDNLDMARVVDLVPISLTLAALRGYSNTSWLPNAHLSLVNISFINRLFDFRRLFHSVAARFDCPDETRAVVCWVDHLFSRLGNIGLVLLQNASQTVAGANHEPLTISRHRDQATLQGAAQLPRMLVNLS